MRCVNDTPARRANALHRNIPPMFCVRKLENLSSRKPTGTGCDKYL